MSHPLRLAAALCAACLVFFCVSAASAQQHLPDLSRSHSLVRLAAARAQAQATYAPKKYRMEFLFEEEPPTYVTFFETTRLYEGDRISEEITQGLSSIFDPTAGLENSSRTTFDYANGRVTYWTWDDDTWVPDTRTTHTYNNNGVLISQLEEEYDAESGTWRNQSRTTNSFSNGLPTQTLFEEWDGSAWVPESRVLVSAQNGGVVIVDQDWTGTAWLNAFRTTYPSMTLNDMMRLQTEVENILGFGFFIFIPTREMASVLYAMEFTEEVWDEAGEAWVNDSRTRVTTNTPATLVAVNEYWDGSAWVPDNRTTLNFSGDLISSMGEESWDEADEAFALSGQTNYTYDGNNNPTLIETFSTNEEDGSLDPLAVQRVVIEWEALGTSVDGDEGPAGALLASVHPSPATDAAEVRFSLAAPGPVMLRVFDVLGREVTTLASGMHPAGTHTARLDAAALPSGVYFVRLEAAGLSDTRSVVIAR